MTGVLRMMAGIEKQPGTGTPGGAHAPLYRVYICDVFTFPKDKEWVLENKSYGVASGVCDAINAKLGFSTPSEIRGEQGPVEVLEVAENIVQRIKERRLEA